LKAFCLAFSIIALTVPATAGELSSASPAGDVPAKSLEWKVTEPDGRKQALYFESTSEADFNAKLRELVALAKEEMRRAAASKDPLVVRVRMRCVERKVIVKRTPERAYVPALAWSAQTVEAEPTLTANVTKACKFKLVRSRPKSAAPEASAQPVPFSVELPALEAAAAN
jgi:hypothetical protein